MLSMRVRFQSKSPFKPLMGVPTRIEERRQSYLGGFNNEGLPGHSVEEPSWLQKAICCKGDSALQFWRTQ